MCPIYRGLYFAAADVGLEKGGERNEGKMDGNLSGGRYAVYFSYRTDRGSDCRTGDDE
jgi:hypothetical protein